MYHPRLPVETGQGDTASLAVNTIDSRGQHAFSFFCLFQGIRRRLFWTTIQESMETKTRVKGGGGPIAWDSGITPGVGVLRGNAHSHDKLTGFLGNLCSTPPEGRKGMSESANEKGREAESQGCRTRATSNQACAAPGSRGPGRHDSYRGGSTRLLGAERPRVAPPQNSPFLGPVLATLPQSLIVNCSLFP